MALADNVTSTAPIGPGKTVSSQKFLNVNSITFDFNSQVYKVNHDNNVITDFELYTVATITYTIASRVATVTIST